MSLVVHDTSARRKVPLETRDPGKVAMYVCGPTVYDHIHIGNARAFVIFDVIRRYLVWRGYDVTLVQNYTDIDDRIITKAEEEGLEASEVAKTYARAFEEVMALMRIDPPDVLARATEHLPEMQEMIGKLIDAGKAYEADGNVWFSVREFDGYGKLSGRSLEDVRAGERVEPDPSKRDPLDFALWKAAKTGEPSWPSPWGDGRPGWHIECSAMSVRYLGMGFDIHGGGSDLIFPHHENEIAQSEAATDQEPFVRYWLHNGMVNIDSEKMSKSLKNFVRLKDFLDEVPASVLRLMAINAHYRSDVDFVDAEMTSARRVLERWSIFDQNSTDETVPDPDLIERFVEAMDDDFNTPEAIGVIHEAVRTGNAAQSAGDDQAAGRALVAFRQMTEVLGLEARLTSGSGVLDEVMSLLIDIRESARAAGRFEEADEIRARLLGSGIVLEDHPEGARWRFKDQTS